MIITRRHFSGLAPSLGFCESKKPCPSLHCEYAVKFGQNFLDMQYIYTLKGFMNTGSDQILKPGSASDYILKI